MLDVYNGVANEINSKHTCEVSVRQMKADNAVIMSGLELQTGECPGEIRTYPVGVADYIGAPAEDCEYLLDRLSDWFSSDWGLGSEYSLAEGILKAITAHIYMVWIHPFGMVTDAEREHWNFVYY